MKSYRLLSLALVFAAMPAIAAELAVKIEIPQLPVAEYPRPYVALWLEKADTAQVTQLAVWYDQKKRDNGGAKWLKDLRQWWRKGGREMEVPVDAVTSATRGRSLHNLSFVARQAPPRPTGGPCAGRGGGGGGRRWRLPLGCEKGGAGGGGGGAGPGDGAMGDGRVCARGAQAAA